MISDYTCSRCDSSATVYSFDTYYCDDCSPEKEYREEWNAFLRAQCEAFGLDPDEVMDRDLSIFMPVPDIREYAGEGRLFTDAQFRRCVDLLREDENILCVRSWSLSKEIIVHTNYVSNAVVEDYCEHFGLVIEWMGVVDDGYRDADCVHEHGPCFEIHLEHDRQTQPLPLEAPFAETYSEAEWLDDRDKVFDASFDDEPRLGLKATKENPLRLAFRDERIADLEAEGRVIMPPREDDE